MRSAAVGLRQVRGRKCATPVVFSAAADQEPSQPSRERVVALGVLPHHEIGDIADRRRGADGLGDVFGEQLLDSLAVIAAAVKVPEFGPACVLRPGDESDWLVLAPHVRTLEAQVLRFRSEPYESDTDVVGPVVLGLTLSATAIDTYVLARLSDIAPDGTRTKLSWGWRRAGLLIGGCRPAHGTAEI